MKDLFKKAYKRLRARTKPRGSVEDVEAAQVRALVSDLIAKVQEPRSAPWIFEARPNPDLYVQAILDLLDAAYDRGTKDATADLSDRIGWECICPCKKHQRVACPYCLFVYGCPVHGNPDPKMLDLELLENPDGLAEAIAIEYQGLSSYRLEMESPYYFSEALRRVVVARFVAIRQQAYARKVLDGEKES